MTSLLLRYPIFTHSKNIFLYTAYYISSKAENVKQYYVVMNGRIPGLYTSWKECENQINKYEDANFKKFKRKEYAWEFLQRGILKLQEQPSLPNEKKIEVLKNILKEFPTEDLNNEYIKSLNVIRNEQNATFNIDKYGYLVVYTDGACSNNGKIGAVAGVGVYFGPGNPLNVSMALDGKGTNIKAEIRAAVLGLQKAQEAGFSKVKIATDSEFLIKCSTLWIEKWKENGWKKLNGTPVSNKKELIDLVEAMLNVDVQWVHVPGHQGVEGNEQADKLARQSILMRTEN